MVKFIIDFFRFSSIKRVSLQKNTADGTEKNLDFELQECW